MRKVVGQAAIALVLFGIGYACWTASRLQDRVADAHEELALLHYSALDATYDDIEQSMGYLRRVPWLTDSLWTNVREHRATAAYWQAHYDALESRRDASGEVVEQEPRVLALSANAAYRTGQRESGDRQAMLRRLDAAVKSYADLLKKNPGDADAAYNYEYIVRLRDAVSKSRPVARPTPESPPGAIQKPTGVVMAGDLPEGRTVHGDPGAPPSTDTTGVKIHIPVRPEEREAGSDAGPGRPRIRKG